MTTDEHLEIIERFLALINSEADNPFILKGGTALLLCYGLDRHSEDIDLDAPGRGTNRDRLFNEVEQFCKQSGYTYRIAKNTDTVQRAFISYDSSNKPLKIELSYRRAEINADLLDMVNGIRVYKINPLCQMKTSAYLSRDKIRDLYDVAYLCTEHFDALSDTTKAMLQNAFEYKDLSQLDYLLKTQDDPLINKDLLETRFLTAFEKVGLLGTTQTTLSGKDRQSDSPQNTHKVEATSTKATPSSDAKRSALSSAARNTSPNTSHRTKLR